MPGTIQVSVLDLMDLPSEAKGSLLSLKVAMGKREYQTTGKGDFSFPVVSLRENLIVALHDMEGNVVSRAEFKTILVVEKGIWDDMFPLEGGGCVRMKLQFSLKEEEYKQIREMRNSALKRKYGVGLLPKLELKNSSSEQNFGGTPTNQLQLMDQDERVNPLDTESMQKIEDHPANSFDQVVPGLTIERQEKVKDNQEKVKDNKETIKMQSPSDGIQERIIPSEKTLDPYRRHTSLGFRNVTEDISSTSAKVEDQIYSPKRKNSLQRSSSSSVKKMIIAFENNTSQGLRPHVTPKVKPCANHIETEGSTKKTSSKEVSTDQVKYPQTMTKSFSAEMLSNINFQQNMKLLKSVVASKQEDVLHFDRGTKSVNIGKNNQLLDLTASENFKNLEPHKQKAVQLKEDGGSSMDTLHIAQPHSSMSTSTGLRPIETDEALKLDLSECACEAADPVLFEVDKGPPTMTMHMDSNALQKKIELDVRPKENYNLDKHNAHGDSDVMPLSQDSKKLEASSMTDGPIIETSPNEDKMDDGIGTTKQIVADYFQISHKISTDYVHREIKNDTLSEEDQLSRENLIDKMADSIGTVEQIVPDDFQLSRKKGTEYIHKEENKNDTLPEEGQLSRENIGESVNIDEQCSSRPNKYDYAYDAVIKETDCRGYRSFSDRQTDSGTSIGTVELFTYSDYEKFPFGSLGIWIPKHLCITSGSKQLRDLVECSSICFGVHTKEKNLFSAEIHEKA